jgi:chemotaxis protein methyltransferase CheR
VDLDLHRADIEALGQVLTERAGLKIHADGEFGLSLALKSRMQALGMSNSANYLMLVRSAEGDAELHRLLPLVTVGKTEFFRDERQFAAITHRLLPERLERARREHRTLRLWSAGCATGEEAYSLAMAAVETGALAAELDLLASDINSEAVHEADRGVFPLRKLKPIHPDRLRRFFVPEGHDAMKVSGELRKLVRFQGLNLAEGPFVAPEGGFDLILCRNVMIYFDASTMVKVLENFYSVLAPGGYLALGYSESLYRIYNRFELIEIHGSFVYRKAEGIKKSYTPISARVTPLMLPVVRPGSSSPFSPTPNPNSNPSQTNPTRTSGLTQNPFSTQNRTGPLRPPTPAQNKTPVSPSSPSDLEETLKLGPSPIDLVPPEAPHRFARSVELMERGQFLEALDLLRALITSEKESLVGWVTLGNLLTVLRRFPEAYLAYDSALSVEPLSAEARLFHGIALCEGNHPSEGLRELGRALFLDADLALAHYYLGRAAEALGDSVTARRSYRNCLGICQSGRPAKPFLAHYPDLPKDPEVLGRAAQYALGALR